MKLPEKGTKGELALQILALFVVGGVVVTAAMMPGAAHILKLFGANTAKERYRLRRSLGNLERRGYIVKTRNGSKDGYQLTETGVSKVRRMMLEKLTIPTLPRWDKKWRVLMFDIPEEFASSRREVSSIIREMGMKKIQNSVFVSPYPCAKEIKKIAQHYDADQFFVYLETDTISCAKELAKHFKLK